MADQAPVVVRVVPDIKSSDKTFDYLVPDELRQRIAVGSLVRIQLGGRRVGGWVVDHDVTPPRGVALKPIVKLVGRGPDEHVIELARWAAWRWAGHTAHFLGPASPDTTVANLPRIERRRVPQSIADPVIDAAFGRRQAVIRLPPTIDAERVVRAALVRGPTLVIVSSVDGARALGARLRRSGLTVALYPRDWAQAAGGADVVIGARRAAWAPIVGPASIVVVDEHDEALQDEGAPTWCAREVALERARRLGIPCILTSPIPSLDALAVAPLVTLSRNEERAAWPLLEIVDRTRRDPTNASLVSDALIRHLRSDRRVVCVLNTTGSARLVACAACATIARCERCEAAVGEVDGAFVCQRCGAHRPVVCASCGASRMKRLRPGTARMRQELAAAAGVAVVEVTGASATDALAVARIYVGTEAVLHRVHETDVVAFLDLDAELLAPRYRAAEQCLALLARAARLVGGRPGRILVQTALPRHEVLDAVLHADPGRLVASEGPRRVALRFPPASAMAAVSGPAAPAFMAAFPSADGVEVMGPGDGRWLIRAADHRTLCDALATVVRPPGRLRIEVDPRRI